MYTSQTNNLITHTFLDLSMSYVYCEYSNKHWFSPNVTKLLHLLTTSELYIHAVSVLVYETTYSLSFAYCTTMTQLEYSWF